MLSRKGLAIHSAVHKLSADLYEMLRYNGYIPKVNSDNGMAHPQDYAMTNTGMNATGG